ncbi:MAG: hypothetical protein II630_01545 [Bacteroidales bacterium]|nr:hypothetical protein [Bacteroidales bacterium]
MGEENEQKEFYLSVNGVDYSRLPEMQRIDFTEHTVKLDGTIRKFSIPEQTFTVRIKPQKRYKATSRKRFVKLCMADGESRNFANLLAEVARENRHSYQLEYFSLLVGAETLRNVVIGK